MILFIEAFPPADVFCVDQLSCQYVLTLCGISGTSCGLRQSQKQDNKDDTRPMHQNYIHFFQVAPSQAAQVRDLFSCARRCKFK